MRTQKEEIKLGACEDQDTTRLVCCSAGAARYPRQQFQMVARGNIHDEAGAGWAHALGMAPACPASLQANNGCGLLLSKLATTECRDDPLGRRGQLIPDGWAGYAKPHVTRMRLSCAQPLYRTTAVISFTPTLIIGDGASIHCYIPAD